jgi:hypothetical protein
MFRIRITSLLFLVAIVAICLGWYVDHVSISSRLKSKQHPVTWYWEKHYLWSPSLHLGCGTDVLEARLSHLVDQFDGEKVVSSQGVSQENLRQPTIDTIESVMGLLNDNDDSIKLASAELLALYLEAVAGRSNKDQSSIEIRAYFHAHAFEHVKSMLESPDSGIRSAGALALGNMFYTRDAEQLIMDSFDREVEQQVKINLAWAYYHITE